MKIYTAHTQSHAPLADIWRSSLAAAEPQAEPMPTLLEVDGGNGDYGNPQWTAVNRAGVDFCLRRIEENMGQIIGLMDSDVVFRKPFVDEIQQGLEDWWYGYDILLQREREDESMFNPGVGFCYCSEKVLKGMARWQALMPFWDGHLPQQNKLMRDAFIGCRIGLLPVTFATPTNGGMNEDAVLVHCNSTPGPNSVPKKLALMQKYLSPR